MSKAGASEDGPTERMETLLPQDEMRSSNHDTDQQTSSRNSVVLCQTVRRSIFNPSISSAAERVSLMLKQEEEKENGPVLFIQLSELFGTPEGLEWRQTAR